MKLMTLTLTGFQSYRDTETIDFTGITSAAIVGPNHSGKSTLVDAVKAALYGEVRTDTITECITTGVDHATVDLIFTVADGTYRIRRTFRAKKGQEATLWVSDPDAPGQWRALTEKNVRQTDEAITTLIGMPADTAAASWLIEQNDFGRFCEATPGARRSMLADAFGLHLFTQWEAAAAAHLHAATTAATHAQWEVDRLESALQDPDPTSPYADISDVDLAARVDAADTAAAQAAADVANLDTPASRSKLDAAEAALAAHQQRQHDQQASYDTAHRLLTAAQEHADTALTAAHTAMSAIADAEWALPDQQAAYAAADNAVSAADTAAAHAAEMAAQAAARAASIGTTIAAIVAQGQEGRQRLQLLDAQIASHRAVCFTCDQSLPPQRASQLRADQDAALNRLLANHRDATTAKADATTAQAAAAQQAAAATAASVRARSTRDHALVTLNRTRDTIAGKDQVAAQLAACEADAEKARTAVAAHAAPVIDTTTAAALTKAVEDAATQHAAATANDTARRTELIEAHTKAKATLRDLWNVQQQRQATAARHQELQEPLAAAKAALAAATADVTSYTVLRDAYSPKGIPAMILAGVIEELNAGANTVLATLGDDGLGVDVRTVRDTARGPSRDEVTVYALTVDGPRAYKSLSGSEKYRLALALRIALCQCVSARTGTPIQTVIQDEGWGAMDEDTKRAALDVLKRLAEEFTVLTVSHIEDVASAFPVMLSVSNATGTSRVTATAA